MEPNLLPLSSFFTFILILILALIHFPAIFCQQTRPYDACGQTLQCGDIVNVEYPFWGLDRPAYCGQPGFQLTCQSGVLLLRYQNLQYRVLQVDSSTQMITFARNDLWFNSCPEFLYNTTYNSTLFNDNNLGNDDISLYYGCNSFTGQLPSNLGEFQCTVNRTTASTSYFIRTSVASSGPGFVNTLVQCNNNIVVPVNQTWGQRFASAAATESDLRSALTAGFRLQWTASNTECDQCVRSGGLCGSNPTSPSLFTCYCANGNFLLTCNNSPPDSAGSAGSTLNTTLKLIIGSSSAGLGIIMCCMIFFVRKRCRHNNNMNHGTKNDRNIEAFIVEYGSLTPRRYKYSEIKKMTKSFQEKLGQGGFGSVFKGKLSDGRLVAVKVLNSSKGNGEEFVNEVASIGRTSHVNVVALLGFCYEGQRSALIYEFMPNGSLERFIHRDVPLNTDQQLGVKRLYEIALGIARGLEYLHCGCSTRILHLDIKPHNILLDEDFCPKIADFGLAKLYSRKESIVSMLEARGTIGYIAPEVFMRNIGRVSHKSDVYSYGMMILEMVGGRENVNAGIDHSSEYFPHWIYKRLEEDDLNNLKLDDIETEGENGFAKKMILIGLWCIQTDPSLRPSMNKVIEMLEGSTEAIQAPPRPSLIAPPRSPEIMSDTSDSMSML